MYQLYIKNKSIKKKQVNWPDKCGSMFCNQDLFIAYLHTVRILAEYYRYIIMCLIKILNHRKILLIHVLGIELEF